MLYKKKLNKELFYTAIATILILTGVVVAQRIVYVFRLAAKGIIPNDTIDTILVFNLLKHLPLLLSITLFLTILMALSRWYKDSEMIVWLSSGLSLSKLVKPIIYFSIPTILLIGFLSLLVSPWAVQKVEEYKNGLKTRDEFSAISPGIFLESKSDNRILYVEGFSELGNTVNNVFIQSYQNGKLGVMVSSKGKRYTNEKGENYIVLLDGKRYEGGRETEEFTTVKYKEYGILIEKDIPSLSAASARVLKMEAKKTIELIGNLSNKKFQAEFLWRLSLPISTFILIIIAIPLSFNNPRSGRSMNIVSAILIFVIYNNAVSISNSLIATGQLSIWIGSWLSHFIFLSIAIYFMYRRSLNLNLIPTFFQKNYK
ncbi:LPS export ABC transporter permease LptF [Methylophilaceae bacterium]|nr:LPS export ABC transporter permease LptF [Methylophilaceae bacterium]